jgi:ribonuclease HI
VPWVKTQFRDQLPNLPIANTLNLAASELTEAIHQAALASIPQVKLGPTPKAWWTPEIKALRKELASKRRAFETLPLGPPQGYQEEYQYRAKAAYQNARNKYFQAIKTAKRNHWNSFLEEGSPKAIYRALAYTKDHRVERLPIIQDESTFIGKAKVLRDSLFPEPPITQEPNWESYSPKTTWKWPPLNRFELQQACLTKAKGKTPGPDSISQEIIFKAYTTAPDHFLKLYRCLIDLGYHPKCWKQATGAILRKNNKPNYGVPKAYRVISLLNCLGKVSERILARRLGYLAETTNLLHSSQIGGRLKKSAIDAALLLTDFIESNKAKKWTTSALFLDIKGAFDHVARGRLLNTLGSLGLPPSLISWVSSFLRDRTIRLSFDGLIEEFKDINIGIPQGSPISPILFLIYIRDLFQKAGPTITNWSYIDDISLATASTSLKKNIQALEKEADRLYQLGKDLAIQFDLDKTELIHFTKGKEAASKSLRLPENQGTIQPKELVRWLGIWFDPNISFKQHLNIRVSQARSAFFRLARLANIERGLSPRAIRQLYIACIVSVADYGSPIWWKGQAYFKKALQSLQNLALRKILGVFRTAPIQPMECESALYPPGIRLDNSLRGYALRAIQLPKEHPIYRLILKEAPYLSEPPECPNSPLPTAKTRKRGRGKPKPPPLVTQTTRIRDSIANIPSLMDLSDLEQITHYSFPPWSLETPYRVEIGSLTKEAQAKAHISLNPGPNTIRAYTDASAIKDPSTKGIGASVTLFGPNYNILHSKGINIGPFQEVYNGELEAITQAAELIASQAQQGFSYEIYADNQASLYRLNKLSDLPGQTQLLRVLDAYQTTTNKGAHLSFFWVPGHCEIAGNEIADQIAKDATTQTPYAYKISLAHLGRVIKALGPRSWKEYLSSLEATKNPNSYRALYTLAPKLRLAPYKVPREVISAFYQLKLGHGYTRHYLHKLGHVPSYKCKCGQRETPRHLLLKCPRLVTARARLKDRLGINRLTIEMLLDTHQGFLATLEFIKETRISTRKRLLLEDALVEISGL